MVLFNFKGITVVPTSNDFIDATLSKTQRKTPTEIHPQYQIARIRHFYTRKVKFTQQNFHDRLTLILDEFPVLDDIHPFYADLINVLYDRDHYKLALGQINQSRHLIDSVGKDYCKLLKYGDSLYRCKQLKRAALGRMCTIMKKQGSSLAYLEQVRQHLARLPSIDPNTRTLLLCGFPNVGKSSFLNRVSRADVDVQPYAFTTRSLFVGHTDYNYLRWQVIDTPGILDHPLEERGTIEMQSVTALAHLRACILFLMDISEQCGYSIEQQVSLFKSIKPLFTGKPVLIVATKIDLCPIESLSRDKMAALQSVLDDETELLPMSNITEEGISAVKNRACERLLAQRVDTKLRSKSSADILARLHVAQPQPRDNKTRPAYIPEAVKKKRLEKQLQAENTGELDDVRRQMDALGNIVYEEEVADLKARLKEQDPEADLPEWMKGFNSVEWKKRYQLQNPEWRFDVIPEIFAGKNIADYIDPDIMKRLRELELEEEYQDEAGAAANNNNEDDDSVIRLTDDQITMLKNIRENKKLSVAAHRMHKDMNKSKLLAVKKNDVAAAAEDGREVSAFEEHLGNLGIDASAAADRMKQRAKVRTEVREGRKRERSKSRERESNLDAIPDDGTLESALQASKVRSRSRSRSGTRTGEILSEAHRAFAVKLANQSQKKRNKEARKGEADRHIPDLKPKHLFSGSRGVGKTERR